MKPPKDGSGIDGWGPTAEGFPAAPRDFPNGKSDADGATLQRDFPARDEETTVLPFKRLQRSERRERHSGIDPALTAAVNADRKALNHTPLITGPDGTTNDQTTKAGHVLVSQMSQVEKTLEVIAMLQSFLDRIKAGAKPTAAVLVVVEELPGDLERSYCLYANLNTQEIVGNLFSMATSIVNDD